MYDQTIAKNWADFKPRDYLLEYYADVGPENLALLRFAVDVFRQLPRQGTLLDFGGGPTIYPLIAAAEKVDEIHFCDYLISNLNEVQNWLQQDSSAFDWSEFVKVTLELENGGACSRQEIQQRQAAIRRLVTRLFRCNANLTRPIDGKQQYDMLVTNFCAESATHDRGQWRKFFHNIISLLKPGGTLLLSALKGASYYTVGRKLFPAVEIYETDLQQLLLDEGFDPASILLESVPADRSSRQYQGLILAAAVKQNGTGSG
jgi:hypothetical protein